MDVKNVFAKLEAVVFERFGISLHSGRSKLGEDRSTISEEMLFAKGLY